MTTFIAQLTKDGGLNFRSPYARSRFKQFATEHVGSEIKLRANDETSREMRGFFEGAVVPYFFYQHFDQGIQIYENEDAAREALKLEFNPMWILDMKGQRIKSAGSTIELNKQEFREFVAKIIQWMEQQGYEIPDSEDYKRWRGQCSSCRRNLSTIEETTSQCATSITHDTN
jgi:hypothetical protein